MPGDSFSQLKRFFDRDVCQRATAPLRDGVEVAVEIPGEAPLVIAKKHGRVSVLEGPATKPDITVHAPPKAISELASVTASDIGDVGIAIVQLMAHSDPDKKIRAKVHIGLFDMLRHGYFGILPLGGAKVMKFLASKGVGGIGKVKEAISRMRE